MSDYFNVGERAALDSFTVPVMRAGFAADIVSAASAESNAASRRSARGAWRRHGRLMIGAGALVLASATAAATGLLERLPIAIPGITRTIAPEAPRPKHVVRAEKPRVPVGKPVTLASVPVPEAAPVVALTPGEKWRERREARIAAGLPVKRPLMARAIAAKLRAMPPQDRKAALAEWRRIKTLPPEERKAAMARVRADYLANHPRMARRYEQRLEARSAAAASAGPPGVVPPPDVMSRPPLLTPELRAERRQRWLQWRAGRRGQRLPTAQ